MFWLVMPIGSVGKVSLVVVETLGINPTDTRVGGIKLGVNYQYVLNTKGSTPAEVLGIDYKATLKPALDEFMDNIKKSSKAKLEELISLQQQSVENASKIESKRNRLAALQSRIDEGEAQLNLLKKEIEDYTSRCAVEAKRMLEDVQREEHNLDLVEKESEEFLKTSKLKLHDVIKQCDEETQMCARELLMLIDTVSKHKEYMESTISQMKNELLETTGAVADAHKASLKLQFGSIFN
ncbi:PREDICTED: uncharacterized protein LOC104589514 [Nelumbo nucifera]|uniref:Uncharacterized protein LOC104589514 n=1 Tax=Nelumbo nucifera TaxID=4432 RepID=A0A1U7YZQ8_NELNU|nr:PREDICTED: uncharacterized protein LOC104589514 [Nelumbo nucifera]